MTNPVAIVQVLLLFDEKNSAAYGPALWAALHEVEAFYNTGRRRMDVRRFYISPYVPASNFLGATWRLLFSPRDMANAIDLLPQDGGVARSPPLAGC